VYGIWQGAEMARLLDRACGARYTHAASGCSAVGSAPRLGRGGRRFKSAHPDLSELLPIYRSTQCAVSGLP
jgi:hypothetical protein